MAGFSPPTKVRYPDRAGQDHSARLLREGVVMGAVTTERTPVPGCRVQPLGVMCYIPVASKAFIKRHLPDGFTAHAVSAAPSLTWNRDDALQDEYVHLDVPLFGQCWKLDSPLVQTVTDAAVSAAANLRRHRK